MPSDLCQESLFQLRRLNLDNVLDRGREHNSLGIVKDNTALGASNSVSNCLELVSTIVVVNRNNIKQSECLLPDHLLGRLCGLVFALIDRGIGHADCEALLVGWSVILPRGALDDCVGHRSVAVEAVCQKNTEINKI